MDAVFDESIENVGQVAVFSSQISRSLFQYAWRSNVCASEETRAHEAKCPRTKHWEPVTVPHPLGKNCCLRMVQLHGICSHALAEIKCDNLTAFPKSVKGAELPGKTRRVVRD